MKKEEVKRLFERTKADYENRAAIRRVAEIEFRPLCNLFNNPDCPEDTENYCFPNCPFFNQFEGRTRRAFGKCLDRYIALTRETPEEAALFAPRGQSEEEK